MADEGQPNTFGGTSSRRLGLCLAALSLFFLFPSSGCKEKTPPPPPPPTVLTITVTPTNVPIFEEWIGTLDGSVNAQINAQVVGYILKQNYSEGSEVKAGDLLFQIDPRPFQATLDQAKAKLAQDQAQDELNRLNVERYTPLVKEQAISQQTLDDAVQAKAGSAALVLLDKAAIENASVNLGFTRITSPIDGLAGLATVQIGNLVGPSTPALTAVSTINPLRVYFQVSEEQYLRFWKKFILTGTTDFAVPPLELILSDGSVYPTRGKFAFANRQVDVTTGTLQIVGLIPNERYVLRPGQFARVRAETEVRTNALMVPQRAVTELQGAFQLAVLGESNKVSIVSVKVGRQVGSNWLIDEGLKPGDRVVVEGTQKAKGGIAVSPKPWVPTNAPGQ